MVQINYLKLPKNGWSLGWKNEPKDCWPKWAVSGPSTFTPLDHRLSTWLELLSKIWVNFISIMSLYKIPSKFLKILVWNEDLIWMLMNKWLIYQPIIMVFRLVYHYNIDPSAVLRTLNSYYFLACIYNVSKWHSKPNQSSKTSIMWHNHVTSSRDIFTWRRGSMIPTDPSC